MGRNEQDGSRIPQGIDDTGDLGRIWDELERLAGMVDATQDQTSRSDAGDGDALDDSRADDQVAEEQDVDDEGAPQA